MKLTILVLAAMLPLSACIFVPDRHDGGPPHGDDRDHHDHDRDHCDHDGHCDHDHYH